MPTRPALHRPMGWRPPEPWQRSAGQRTDVHALPSNWRALRQQVLQEEPLCRSCLAGGFVTTSEEVDHIVPRSQGGRSDRTNLAGICKPCHRAKTQHEAMTARESHERPGASLGMGVKSP